MTRPPPLFSLQPILPEKYPRLCRPVVIPIRFFLSCRALKLNHASICDNLPPQRPVAAVLRLVLDILIIAVAQHSLNKQPAPIWGGEAALHSTSRRRSGSSAGDRSSLLLNESAGPTNACCPSHLRLTAKRPLRQHPRGCYRQYRLRCIPSMVP